MAVFQESLSESRFPFSLLFSDCTAYRQYISFSYHSNREFQAMRLFYALPDTPPCNEPGKYGQSLFYLLASFFPQYAHRYFPVGDGALQKTATVIAASRILRRHCFKCKIPSSAITLHMIFFPSGTFLFFIIYSAIFPPDTGIFLPPQKNAAALYAFCSISYSYGICLCQCCNFLYFNFCFYSL